MVLCPTNGPPVSLDAAKQRTRLSHFDNGRSLRRERTRQSEIQISLKALWSASVGAPSRQRRFIYAAALTMAGVEAPFAIPQQFAPEPDLAVSGSDQASRAN